jgi:hypothetical protein
MESFFTLHSSSIDSSQINKQNNNNNTQTPLTSKIPDDNINNNCSRGLHVGGLAYIRSHDDTILVKVDPRDVVCIPAGEHDKIRCCKFEVLSLYTQKQLLTPNMDYEYEENVESLKDCDEGDSITISYAEYDEDENEFVTVEQNVYFFSVSGGTLYYYKNSPENMQHISVYDITEWSLSV